MEEKIRGDKNLERKLMTLVHGGVLQPPGQEPPPGMGSPAAAAGGGGGGGSAPAAVAPAPGLILRHF